MSDHWLSEDIFKTLRILASNGDYTQRDLSSHLGMSLGKTNYLLKSLGNKGLVKVRNFSRRDNKMKKVHYYLTKKGIQTKLHMTRHFLLQKEKEYLDLKREFEKSGEKSPHGYQETV